MLNAPITTQTHNYITSLHTRGPQDRVMFEERNLIQSYETLCKNDNQFKFKLQNLVTGVLQSTFTEDFKAFSDKTQSVYPYFVFFLNSCKYIEGTCFCVNLSFRIASS